SSEDAVGESSSAAVFAAVSCSARVAAAAFADRSPAGASSVAAGVARSVGVPEATAAPAAAPSSTPNAISNAQRAVPRVMRSHSFLLQYNGGGRGEPCQKPARRGAGRQRGGGRNEGGGASPPCPERGTVTARKRERTAARKLKGRGQRLAACRRPHLFPVQYNLVSR